VQAAAALHRLRNLGGTGDVEGGYLRPTFSARTAWIEQMGTRSSVWGQVAYAPGPKIV
jgi:hypothetical protein